MDARTLKSLRKSLSEERDRLAADLGELEKAGHEALSDMSGENNYRDHMADQGTATFAKELDMQLEENVRDLLSQADRAIARIDSGEYGKCASCGKAVTRERLKAVPAAELCIECQEAEEKE